MVEPVYSSSPITIVCGGGDGGSVLGYCDIGVNDIYATFATKHITKVVDFGYYIRIGNHYNPYFEKDVIVNIDDYVRDKENVKVVNSLTDADKVNTWYKLKDSFYFKNIEDVISPSMISSIYIDNIFNKFDRDMDKMRDRINYRIRKACNNIKQFK